MEEKNLAKLEGALQRRIEVTPDQLAVIKRTIFPTATDDELKIFVYECTRRGVHPFDRKIFPVKYKTKEEGEEKTLAFITSIDMFRSEAQETGEYAATGEPEYGEEKEQGFPEWAKVTVWRYVPVPDGSYERTSFTATARWKEFYPGEKKGFMWRSKPYHMLAKCAEAQAFRKAFPQKLAGLYVPEEMDQAGAGGEQRSLSESVEQKQAAAGKAKPAPAGLQAKKDPPKVALQKELAEYCKRTGKTVGDALKEVTSFKKDDGTEAFARQIEKMSDAWAGKALSKLREIMPKEAPAPTSGTQYPMGCTQDPQTCSESAWEDKGGGNLTAICSTKEGCPFPLPE